MAINRGKQETRLGISFEVPAFIWHPFFSSIFSLLNIILYPLCLYVMISDPLEKQHRIHLALFFAWISSPVHFDYALRSVVSILVFLQPVVHYISCPVREMSLILRRFFFFCFFVWCYAITF